jgi:signal transduction histidine kinase
MNTTLQTSSDRRLGPPAGSPITTLAEIDITGELDSRPPRVPDYKREQDSFSALAAELARRPHGVLQRLSEAALDLCNAHSAGVSLLDGDQFRCEAAAGALADARGGTMPRQASPHGVCVERDCTRLMNLPDRCFPALVAEPRVVEVMLLPFHERERAVGTVWIVSHSENRRFDREDERIVRKLANYAAAGWQFWKASERAEESNRRKDRLLATLGHELRNPLAAIAAATVVLEEYVEDGSGAARAIDVIARQTRHVERLAGDLLDSGRLASGKLRLKTAPLDLWNVVTDAVETCRTRIAQFKVDVSVKMHGPSAIVDGDAVRLAQVFSNLIDNAVKFTPAGGRVTITGELDRTSARVAIRDTGAGIPCDQIQRIFEPFAQLHDGRETSAAGRLGIGLSIVRSLVELHSGTVSVVSDGPGKGSCFTVCLPVQVP